MDIIISFLFRFILKLDIIWNKVYMELRKLIHDIWGSYGIHWKFLLNKSRTISECNFITILAGAPQEITDITGLYRNVQKRRQENIQEYTF